MQFVVLCLRCRSRKILYINFFSFFLISELIDDLLCCSFKCWCYFYFYFVLAVSRQNMWSLDIVIFFNTSQWRSISSSLSATESSNIYLFVRDSANASKEETEAKTAAVGKSSQSYVSFMCIKPPRLGLKWKESYFLQLYNWLTRACFMLNKNYAEILQFKILHFGIRCAHEVLIMCWQMFDKWNFTKTPG